MLRCKRALLLCKLLQRHCFHLRYLIVLWDVQLHCLGIRVANFYRPVLLREFHWERRRDVYYILAYLHLGVVTYTNQKNIKLAYLLLPALYYEPGLPYEDGSLSILVLEAVRWLELEHHRSVRLRLNLSIRLSQRKQAVQLILNLNGRVYFLLTPECVNCRRTSLYIAREVCRQLTFVYQLNLKA